MNIKEKLKIMHDNPVVAWHEHFWSTGDFKTLNTAAADDMMRVFDLIGVDKVVTSLPVNTIKRCPPEVFVSANNVTHEAVKRFPGRVYGMAYAHPGYAKEAVAEIERCVKEFGFVGVKLYYDYFMDDPVYAPIIEKCIELDIPILQHSMHFMDAPNKVRQPLATDGVLELEDTEAVIVLDENGTPVDVVRRERGVGEKLIEQFMLQANMGVAEVLKSLALPCLYRTHEKPDGDKIRSFAVFAHNLGLSTRGIVNSEMSSIEMTSALLSEKLMQILSDANEKGIGPMVSTMLLRSMMKAKYQSVCSMHFGLGAETYCHFTSPIRRYPDLFVHTVITEVLEKYGIGELTSDSSVPSNAVPALEKIAHERGVSSSETEITAQTAEREIEDLYMTLYMSSRIGEVFHVTVSSVIRSGMFVQCDNLVEGFVPASFYPGSKVNEDFMTLTVGTKVYTLGTQLDVRLIEADVSAGKITFEPVRNTEE